ncbi:hypothetical protein XF24_00213 [candidate division SR1 bacterium Aalborg_AAW-1]|nr:hypothetical protein XF24_00213 [candidate division SR1 bacterium Aalborg_AAW-1]
METRKTIDTVKKERRILKKTSLLIQSQKNTIKALSNIISSGVGYLPGAGPMKSLGEGIVGKDFLTKRKIRLSEQLLKITAGASGLTGYYYLLKPYFNGAEPTLDDISGYASLELCNMALYTLSLLAAGGEQAQKVKNIKQQLYETIQTSKKIIRTTKGNKKHKNENNISS